MDEDVDLCAGTQAGSPFVQGVLQEAVHSLLWDGAGGIAFERLYDVVAQPTGHDAADLACVERKGYVFDFDDEQGIAREPAEVSAFVAGASVAGELGGELGEVGTLGELLEDGLRLGFVIYNDVASVYLFGYVGYGGEDGLGELFGEVFDWYDVLPEFFLGVLVGCEPLAEVFGVAGGVDGGVELLVDLVIGDGDALSLGFLFDEFDFDEPVDYLSFERAVVGDLAAKSGEACLFAGELALVGFECDGLAVDGGCQGGV